MSVLPQPILMNTEDDYTHTSEYTDSDRNLLTPIDIDDTVLNSKKSKSVSTSSIPNLYDLSTPNFVSTNTSINHPNNAHDANINTISHTYRPDLIKNIIQKLDNFNDVQVTKIADDNNEYITKENFAILLGEMRVDILTLVNLLSVLNKNITINNDELQNIKRDVYKLTDENVILKDKIIKMKDDMGKEYDTIRELCFSKINDLQKQLVMQNQQNQQNQSQSNNRNVSNQNNTHEIIHPNTNEINDRKISKQNSVHEIIHPNMNEMNEINDRKTGKQNSVHESTNINEINDRNKINQTIHNDHESISTHSVNADKHNNIRIVRREQSKQSNQSKQNEYTQELQSKPIVHMSNDKINHNEVTNTHTIMISENDPVVTTNKKDIHKINTNLKEEEKTEVGNIFVDSQMDKRAIKYKVTQPRTKANSNDVFGIVEKKKMI